MEEAGRGHHDLGSRLLVEQDATEISVHTQQEQERTQWEESWMVVSQSTGGYVYTEAAYVVGFWWEVARAGHWKRHTVSLQCRSSREKGL